MCLVYANHGRWIAECTCRSASQVEPREERWRCDECGTHYALEWPPDVWEIERLLKPRPKVNQNWRVGETLADLHAENQQHGVEAVVES
jgi:hypothetical protein